MNLDTYLDILWRRKLVVFATWAATILVTVLLTLRTQEMYTAATTLRVATSLNSSRIDYGLYLYSTRLMNTYASMIQSRPVLEQMEEEFGFTVAPHVSVAFPANTELMEIVVESSDPVLATNVANRLAEVLIEEDRLIRRANAMSVVEPAYVPEDPSSPNKKLNLALAFIAGTIGGLGLAFLFESIDSTLYNPDQIEKATELPILGKIPAMVDHITWTESGAAHGESFRRLRTNLLGIHNTSPLRTLMITSAQPQEGKSTILANLGYVLAQSGRKVIVVDCDLRMPSLHEIFQVPNERGISNVLRDEVDLEDALQETSIPGLRVMTSGSLPDYPAELFSSPQMLDMIGLLVQHADMVLFDTPSFLAVSDASVLCSMMDGVMMVVARGKAQAEAVRTVRHQLTDLKAVLVGVVVNRADPGDSGEYYRYYTQPSDQTTKPTSKNPVRLLESVYARFWQKG